jgi:hypothetical protein
MHMRMATPAQIEEMLGGVEEIAGDAIEYADATLVRLNYGADPGGSAHEQLSRLALSIDPINCQNVSEEIRANATSVDLAHS